MINYHILTNFGFDSNPIGFAASDFLEVVFAALVILAIVNWQAWADAFTKNLLNHSWRCMLLLASLPIVLRLALYPNHPAPTPMVHDEFVHLLIADTLTHLRLANPVHPMHRFFETIYVLQEPVYAGKYPIGQGIMLAIGQLLGHPWAGVVIANGLLCALSFWMLKGWTTARWAFAGGLLCLAQFTVLTNWMNNYWGGTLSACAGCLVFGALPRLVEHGRRSDAAFLGLGLGMHALIRPYETIALTLCAGLYLAVALVRRKGMLERLKKAGPGLAMTAAPIAGLILLHNYAVTGNVLKLPYQLSQQQYGVPSAMLYQKMPVPQRPLTPQQWDMYEYQRQAHDGTNLAFRGRFGTLLYNLQFSRFFFLPPVYLALPFALLAVTEGSFIWMVLFPLLFAVGELFYTFFGLHYVAAVVPIYLLWSITALDRLSRVTIRGKNLGAYAVSTILAFCAAHFVFWYGLHLFDNQPFSVDLRPYSSQEGLNHRLGNWKADLADTIAAMPGKVLIFVHYLPNHDLHSEWVYNRADIDNARVVWARDLGPEENDKLIRYFGGRNVWYLDADRNASLTQYTGLEK